MKIVVDAFGGDNAPAEIIKGAIDAINQESGFNLVLCGNEEGINNQLSKYNYDKKRVEIFHAVQIITNDDIPTEAIRRKKDSSIVKSFELLNKDEDAVAFVSAGSTGAVLAGAVLLLPRIKGINRPALAPILPTVKGGNVILIDCGANVSCKPINILQFAYMGKAYAKAALGINNPRIGLLSNGAEDSKGSDLNKEVFPILMEDKELNFVGNIEGRDIIFGDVDVIVTDGFTGNIALKSIEGAALSLFEIIKKNILAGGIRAKLGYLLLKPAFKNVKKTMDYNDNGGAILIGLNKIIIKSHGSSKAKSIKASILQAKSLYESKIIDEIKGCLPQQKND